MIAHDRRNIGTIVRINLTGCCTDPIGTVQGFGAGDDRGDPYVEVFVHLTGRTAPFMGSQLEPILKRQGRTS